MRFNIMNHKGQGAIEYLLIIAAAILVVAIVILAITGALTGGQNQTTTSQTQQQNAMTQLEIQLELAKGHIQIASPTDIPTVGNWQEGKTYFLSENIASPTNYFINLYNAKNVILDCMGRSLTFLGGSGFPISGTSTTNVTIKNCVFEDQFSSFYFNNPTNLTIDNVQVNNLEYGAIIQGGTVAIKNSDFCATTENGIYCYYSPAVTTENTKAYNPYGCGVTFDPCP